MTTPLAGFRLAHPQRLAPGHRRAEECMGTVFSFDVRDLDADVAAAAVDAAVRWLHDVDARFSPYRPDSEVSAVADGRRQLADASPQLREVLSLAAEVAAMSDGAFTTTPFGRFDPSGVVKGWAIERAAAVLVEHGAQRFSINGGGDVQTRGFTTAARRWQIGISDPADRSRLVAVVRAPSAEPMAVATSGTAERGAHIDRVPDDGAGGGLASITLVGTGLAWVDACATAAYAKGEDGLRWVEKRLDGVEALAVGRDGRTAMTAGFPGLLAG